MNMAESTNRNIRLGIFVISGTLLLVLALYLIGNKQNLFGSTVRVSARFYNVDGLMQGNNVRFAGIDVGTVESVEIENDSTVRVSMVIEEDVRKFIKKNSIASVGTDGLMGNKLVNINSAATTGQEIEEGDELRTQRPIEMDEMVRTLNVTNENIRIITGNLRSITDKINSRNSLWSILMDTLVADNIRSTVVNLKLTSGQALTVTGDLRELTSSVKAGKGTLGALVMDTTISGKIRQTVVNLQKVSDTTAILTGNISEIVRGLKNGKGSLGLLLTDTTVVHNLNKSIISIDTAGSKFSGNMEALRYSWPFKKYFRKK